MLFGYQNGHTEKTVSQIPKLVYFKNPMYNIQYQRVMKIIRKVCGSECHGFESHRAPNTKHFDFQLIRKLKCLVFMCIKPVPISQINAFLAQNCPNSSQIEIIKKALPP